MNTAFTFYLLAAMAAITTAFAIAGDTKQLTPAAIFFTGAILVDAINSIK